MTEPTDYERGLRDGAEIARAEFSFSPGATAAIWLFWFVAGAAIGAVMAL